VKVKAKVLIIFKKTIMKNLNDFLSSEKWVSILTVSELSTVKGGDDPNKKVDSDPFKLP